MAARWFEVKRDAEPVSMWAPPGAPYLLNVNHPQIREEYERAKRAFRVPHIYPMDDMQRWVWEMDIIQRYCGRQTPSGAAWERRKKDYPSDEHALASSPDKGSLRGSMPAHVVYRLKVPPYRGILLAQNSVEFADEPQTSQELWETTPSTAVRRSPSLDEGGEDVGIKKDR